MEENNNGKAKPIQPNNNISLDDRASNHQALHPADNSTTFRRSKIDNTNRSVKITETKGIMRIKRQGLGSATWRGSKPAKKIDNDSVGEEE